MVRPIDTRHLVELTPEQALEHVLATLAVSNNHRGLLLSMWPPARRLVEAYEAGADRDSLAPFVTELERCVHECDPGRVLWPNVEDLTGRDQGQAERAGLPTASGNGDRIEGEGGELFDEEEPPAPAAPPAVAVSRCSAEECNAPILWLRHERTHRATPVDARPADGGNIVVFLATGTYRLATNEEKLTLQGQLHYNHFATCSKSKQFTRQMGRGIA